MKIISITTIKNEADIIESFIRYHLNIVDEMIILNNGSTDDTNDILNHLMEENLPIIILNDYDRYFEPLEKYNCLLRLAVNEYDADIICPLDVDEFITCPTGNPREIIEKIPQFTYYRVKWKTYIPSKFDDNTIKFIPSRIVHVRDEKIETFYKTILTKDLVKQYNVRLTTGNHDLKFQDQFEKNITCEEHPDLKIAHFPLRSIEQMTSKVLVSYPNTLSRKNVNPNMSHHYPLMFKKILNKGFLEIEDVIEFAKQYSLEENKGKNELTTKDITTKKDPMNLNFCKNISIQYDFKIKPMINVLNNYIYFAKEIHTFKGKIDNAYGEYETLENKFKKNMILLGDKDKEIRLLHNDLNKKNDEIINVKKESEESYAKLNNIEYKYDHINKEITNKNNQIQKLTQALDRSENRLTELTANYSENLSNTELKYKTLHEHLIEKNLQLENMNNQHFNMNIKLEKTNYCKKFYKNQFNQLKIENKFLKKKSIINVFLTYIYLIFKSKPSEIKLNYNLLRLFNKTKCFNIGFYLNNYPYVLNSKLGKISPELHYICYGFNEKKEFNERKIKLDNKKDLLKYIKQNFI